MTYLEKLVTACRRASVLLLSDDQARIVVRALMASLFGLDNIAWLDQEGATDAPVGPGFWGYRADKDTFLGAQAPQDMQRQVFSFRLGDGLQRIQSVTLARGDTYVIVTEMNVYRATRGRDGWLQIEEISQI